MLAAAAQPAAVAVELPLAPELPVAVEPAVAAERGVSAYAPDFFASASPTSAYEMIIRLPGFTFEKGAAVRGLADSGGNVLIDGQPPVSKNDTLDELLKRIPAGAVARIELIRGGAPGIDMQGKSVLANVVRKTTGGFRAAVAPSVNLIYDHRVLIGGRVEAQWRWSGGRSAEFSQVYGSGPNEELGDGTRVRTNANGSVRLRSNVDADSGGRREWTTGAYETPLAGGRIRFTGAYLLNPSYVELYDRYVGGGREYEYDRVDTLQIETGARYSRKLGDRLDFEGVAFHQANATKAYVHFEAPGLGRDFRLSRHGGESVGRVTLKLRQSDRLSFEAALEGADNTLDSVTRLTVNARALVVPAANVQLEEKRAEVTLRATWQATPALNVEGGLRQERSTVTSAGDVTLTKNLQFLKPRLAVTWIPSPANQFRLRAEREVGQLNFDDFVASSGVASTGTLSAGNPNLTPQQAWVYEAAYERRFWTAGSLVLTARRSELTDVVDRIPIFGPGGVILADAPGNIGAGRRDELQASVTVPLDRLGVRSAQLRAQVTRRWASVVDPLTGRTREISNLRTSNTRDPSGVSPVNWEVHFTQDVPAWKSVWGADIIGGYREVAYRLAEVETRKISTAVTLFDEYRVRPDLTLRVELQLLNQRHARRIRQVYAGPRNLGVLDYTDLRDLKWGGSLMIRLRKTFG